MKFPMDRPVKIVMLGAGGTGGYVAPYLFRLLHMLDIPCLRHHLPKHRSGSLLRCSSAMPRIRICWTI